MNFGGLLVFAATRMLVAKKEKKIEIEKNIAVRFLKTHTNCTSIYRDDKFGVCT